MALIHNSVPTTCTATQITGWSIPNLNSSDPVQKLRAQKGAIGELKRGGFKRDFAIIMATTTQNQIKNGGLEEFMPKIGFKAVFRGVKSDDKDKQRHQETGDITLWATTPKEFEESILSFEKELNELAEKIDPPKKPDPARQRFPEVRGLARNNIVHANTRMDNPISEVLIVSEEVAHRYIKFNFGIDVRAWKNAGTDWTRMSIRQLRAEQQRWKDELI